MKKIKTILIAVFILSIAACTKDKKVVCPQIETLVAIPPNLYFNIIDKPTGKNLFLGNNTKYDTSQLRIFYRWMSSGQKIPVSIDSARFCFVINSFQDSMFMQVANLSVDTLVFGAVRGLQTSPCVTLSYVDSLNFDRIDYVADDKQIITIKK